MGIKVAMTSLGCSKNLVDAETMLGTLEDRGYEIVENPAHADAIVVNTCGFIEAAQKESIEAILDMARHKDGGRCRAIIVTGCMAQMFKEQIKPELPEVDAVLGTGSYSEIASAIESALSGDFYESFSPIDRRVLHGDRRVITTPPYTAFLKIAEGCSNRCAYCAIPSLRGPFRSRPIEEIYDEAAALCRGGVRELVVISQDTTRYGEDIYKRGALPELLARLCEIPEAKWIRVHYCYPERIDDRLLEVMAKEDKIVKYFDVPVQHCSDGVLKRMNRKGDGDMVRGVLQKIREKVPGAVIRTTLMVGFPGESDEDFEELCGFVKEMRFERMGAFAFSPQEGTPAYSMEDQVEEEVQRRRLELLMELQGDISESICKGMVGRRLLVLCEGADENGVYFGRSYMDSPDIDPKVYFTCERGISPGEFVHTLVTGSDRYDLFAATSED